jgi:MoaA/NifB/PqqE/SkfB family radical SAM enzyme
MRLKSFNPLKAASMLRRSLQRRLLERALDSETCEIELGNFENYRFTKADFATIDRFAGRYTVVANELFRIVKCLNGRPVSSFSSISELYAATDNSATPTPYTIIVLRDLFIDRVNRRLQAELYSKHFLTHPMLAHASHQDRIASLEATHVDAQAIVDSYDWHWLASWLQLESIGEDAESSVRRLSNFAFPVGQVNFRFTYHCNIACRHCYNGSGPHKKTQHIHLNRMLAIVAQMPAAGIGHLNLTGGEPFLYPDHLTALIAAGRAVGLPGISIYTNGYWATNEKHAERMLEQLAAAGFMSSSGDSIKVSAGVYHQEFISFDRVLILARIYSSMFGQRLLVDFEVTPRAGDQAARVQRLVRDCGLSDQINLFFRQILPLGRGGDLEGFKYGSIDTPCDSINQIVFDPDGIVRPCCGFNNENRGVIIGNLETHGLKDLIKRMQNDPVLQLLAKKPMSTIFEHVEKSQRTKGYSGACDLCQDALGDLEDKDSLQRKLSGTQEFYPFWFTLRKPHTEANLDMIS